MITFLFIYCVLSCLFLIKFVISVSQGFANLETELNQFHRQQHVENYEVVNPTIH